MVALSFPCHFVIILPRDNRSACTAFILLVLHLLLQAGWIEMSAWPYGDAACRTFAFFRVFGRYLSSYLVACIGLERWMAVFQPFQIIQERIRKVKIMIFLSWIGSILLSLPDV